EIAGTLGVIERSQRGARGSLVDAVAGDERTRLVYHRGGGYRVPGAKAWQTINLGGRGGKDEPVVVDGTIVKWWRAEGLVSRVVVGLVDEDVSVRRSIGDEVFDVFAGSDARGGIVGIADVNKICGGIGASQHGLEIVREFTVERNSDDVGSNRAGVLTGLFESGRCLHQFLSRPKQTDSSHAQDFRRPAAEEQLIRLHRVEGSDAVDQLVVFIARIAIAQRKRVFHGGEDFGGGAVGVLVGVETHGATGDAGASRCENRGKGRSAEGQLRCRTGSG